MRNFPSAQDFRRSRGICSAAIPARSNILSASVIIAGILARTQAIPKQDRRRFLNDALLFLQALDTGSIMVSRNSRDLDLLLQLKPRALVLLYDKS